MILIAPVTQELMECIEYKLSTVMTLCIHIRDES